MSWSLKEKADRLLSQETGTIRKDWGGRVAFALVYPNTYAVGMSNLGFQTIYRHLNALPDVVCERVFLPDPGDLPEYRRTGTQPFSLESKRPLVGLRPRRLLDHLRGRLHQHPSPSRERRHPAAARAPPAGGPLHPDGRRVRVREPGAGRAVHGLRGGGRGGGDRRRDRGRLPGDLRRDVARRPSARRPPGPPGADPGNLRASALRGVLQGRRSGRGGAAGATACRPW